MHCAAQIFHPLWQLGNIFGDSRLARLGRFWAARASSASATRPTLASLRRARYLSAEPAAATTTAAAAGTACLAQGAFDWAAAALVAAERGRLAKHGARRGGATVPLLLIAAHRTDTLHRQQGIGMTQVLHFFSIIIMHDDVYGDDDDRIGYTLIIASHY